MYMFLCEHKLLFLLDIYLGIKFLDHIAMLCILRSCQIISQSDCTILHFHEPCIRVPFPLCHHLHITVCLFKFCSSSWMYSGYLTILLCIFLKKMVNTFLCAYLTFVDFICGTIQIFSPF
jgi:hypothetical protein